MSGNPSRCKQLFRYMPEPLLFLVAFIAFHSIRINKMADQPGPTPTTP
jgi:hypothetical protein